MGKLVKPSNNRTGNITSDIIKNNANTINYFFILLLAILLVVAPFYRGLYFRENYMLSIVYMSAVFMLYLLYKLVRKDYRLISTYMDIAMLSLPIVYLISFFFSVSSMDAMDAVIKYAAYFMIYKIASDLSSQSVYRKALEYTVMTAMLVMAGTGLLASIGYLELKGVIMYNRIYGLYQYSNATASAMGAAMFLAVGLASNSSKLYEKLYYYLVLALAFPTFILTFSRGAYLIFALLAVLYLILLEARNRVQFIYSMFALVAANIIFIYEYFSKEAIGDPALYLFIGIIIFLALQLLYEKLIIKHIERISVKAVNIVLISGLVVSALVLLLVFSIKVPAEYKIEHASGEKKSWKPIVLPVGALIPDNEYSIQFLAKSNVESENGYRVIIQSLDEAGKRSNILEKNSTVGKEFEQVKHGFTTNMDAKSVELHIYNYEENSNTVYKDIRILDSKGNVVKKFEKFKYMPDALVERISDIGLESTSVSTRAYYIKDGIKIIKDYFLFGTGGGGWKNLYRKYQSLPYNSTEAHNFYLQYVIETGILGIIVLFSIYCLFIKRAFAMLFKDRNNEQLSLYIALFMMMGHAVLDFDLSLTALAFLFWMMLGMAVPGNKQSGYTIPASKQIQALVPIAAIIVLYLSSSMYMGISQGNTASKLYKTDVEKSIKLYESAMRKDSYNNNYHMDYMQIMYGQYQSNKEPATISKIKGSLDKVLANGVYDIKYYSVVVNQLLNIGNLDKAISVTDELVSNNPMLAEAYMFKIDVNYQIAKFYFENNQKEKALPYLFNMIEAGDQFDNINKISLEPLVEPKNLRPMVGLAENWIGQVEKSKGN